jgi:hypothetical protein
VTHARAVAMLDALDACEHEARVSTLSLAPHRVHRTPFGALGRALLTDRVPVSVGEAFAGGLTRFVDATRESFPHNVFSDFDRLAREVLRAAEVCDPSRGVHCVSRAWGRLAAMQKLFGGNSAIRFRYVHDFAYGFDWAKWVQRDPASRAHIGPFDPVFLDAMLTRGYELLSLIARDDATYGQLPDARPRNPFGFSREPFDEIRLHEALACAGWIPVRAWETEGACDPMRPYAATRVAFAARMGLCVR